MAAGEVQKALKRHGQLVTHLRARLTALEEGVGRAGMQVLKDGPFPMVSETRMSKRRRKPRISAATRKLYQQQGRYMAALRNLTEEQRATIKALREESGVRKAIAVAKGMVK